MIEILIASDVRLFSDGIASIVASQVGYEVIGVAPSLEATLAALGTRSPDVILLDQSMPASLVALEGARRLRPASRVVVLGVPAGEEALLAWAEAGMSGFVPREASVEDLLATISCAIRGEFRCNPLTAASLLRRLAWRATTAATAPARTPLTARETEVGVLIGNGLSNKQIAARLGIEITTVKNHVHNLLEKLRVSRRAEAAAELRGWDPRRTTPQR